MSQSGVMVARPHNLRASVDSFGEVLHSLHMSGAVPETGRLNRHAIPDPLANAPCPQAAKGGGYVRFDACRPAWLRLRSRVQPRLQAVYWRHAW